MENPLKHFAELRVPRVERNREHLLEEMLLIAIAAGLSGAWVAGNGLMLAQREGDAGHSGQNFSTLNRIALNILKHDKSSKRGIKGKRLNAAWDRPYLLKLLEI